MLELNETPIRTSRNFNINNIKLENANIPNNIGKFNNVQIIGNTLDNINKDDTISLKYGISPKINNQVLNNYNQKIDLILDEKNNDERIITFKLDKDNLQLVDNINIYAKENSKATVIIQYLSEKDIDGYHNGIINAVAHENAKLDIIILNLINNKSQNFLSIQSNLKENSNIRFTIVDFGGKYSITNLYSNLSGNNSDSKINAIYLGTEDQILDLNYIAEIYGEKSNINIEVQGALKGFAKKHFKGTIDFKKGCKKSKGDENESCMLLSNTAKSLALPMLLCSEEDVIGNHSCSSGKIENKELFYIMSRGFSLKEAEKLLVRAKFNKIIENIENEEIKEQILDQIDRRLD